MWIKENEKMIWVTKKESFERMTKEELVEQCLEYHSELYADYKGYTIKRKGV